MVFLGSSVIGFLCSQWCHVGFQFNSIRFHMVLGGKWITSSVTILCYTESTFESLVTTLKHLTIELLRSRRASTRYMYLAHHLSSSLVLNFNQGKNNYLLSNSSVWFLLPNATFTRLQLCVSVIIIWQLSNKVNTLLPFW